MWFVEFLTQGTKINLSLPIKWISLKEIAVFMYIVLITLKLTFYYYF